MDYNQLSLDLHRAKRGKLEIRSTVPLATREDLCVAYTPGVAAPCMAIARDAAAAWELTIKGRTVAVVTDGTSVLGLGDIGPLAALPVMEGKAILYKEFAGVDAFPICLATTDVDEMVETIVRIAPVFGGIHLEDVAAPRCFELEEKLQARLDVPVMHDDQHGTAVVVAAGLMNALKVVGKSVGDVRVVVSGSGAAGMACAWLMLEMGVRKMDVLDSKGLLAVGRAGMNPYKDRLAARINPEGRGGTLAEVLRGADVFVGVSQPGLVKAEDVRTMAPGAIVFAMSNPTPEIMPDEAHAGGAVVVASGRSDFPNQINNVLAYPGMFLAALEARFPAFTMAKKRAAAVALAGMVPQPTADRIIPDALDRTVARIVADAVKNA